MLWSELINKLRKQPLKTTQHNNAIIEVHLARTALCCVEKLNYINGKLISMDASEIYCGNCKYFKKNIPHTCDICTSLDENEYCMWKKNKA